MSIETQAISSAINLIRGNSSVVELLESGVAGPAAPGFALSLAGSAGAALGVGGASIASGAGAAVGIGALLIDIFTPDKKEDPFMQRISRWSWPVISGRMSARTGFASALQAAITTPAEFQHIVPPVLGSVISDFQDIEPGALWPWRDLEIVKLTGVEILPPTSPITDELRIQNVAARLGLTNLLDPGDIFSTGIGKDIVLALQPKAPPIGRRQFGVRQVNRPTVSFEPSTEPLFPLAVELGMDRFPLVPSAVTRTFPVNVAQKAVREAGPVFIGEQFRLFEDIFSVTLSERQQFADALFGALAAAEEGPEQKVSEVTPLEPTGPAAAAPLDTVMFQCERIPPPDVATEVERRGTFTAQQGIAFIALLLGIHQLRRL